MLVLFMDFSNGKAKDPTVSHHNLDYLCICKVQYSGLCHNSELGSMGSGLVMWQEYAFLLEAVNLAVN